MLCLSGDEGLPLGKSAFSFFLEEVAMGGHDFLKILNRQKDGSLEIAEEEMPQIFKRFYRTSDSSEEGNAAFGLGLGLAIASRIVELHGSRLSVDSVLHQGTTFRFSLPAPG